MGTIRDLLDKAKFVRDNIPNEVFEIVQKNKDKIVEFNKDQLFEGKTIFNQDIRPYYTEDPFFKTAQAARNYIAWKQRITPNSKRNPNAPNLYINGYYHSSIDLIFSGKTPLLESRSGSLFSEINNKYQNIIGLNEDHALSLNYEIIKPELQEFINKYIG
jgi:hypothetical protein